MSACILDDGVPVTPLSVSLMFVALYDVVFCFAGPSNCYKVVKMIMERNLQPVIVFSFSKRECEAYALQMAKLDFNTGTGQLMFSYLLACFEQMIEEDML